MFSPTTIRALGHDEAFLEARIAEHPDLLGMESLASGIQGPFRVFRQLSLPTPSGRVVSPDLVLVSRSAHLVVVEVKLADNPELKSRAVVAQVVDYSSSLSTLAHQGELASLFAADTESLEALAAEWFAGESDPKEYAEVLEARCADGDIDLVIACDQSPPGLDDLGEAVHRQSALAFRLQVVEVTPFVASRDGAILFEKRVRARTEIVARTHVSVSWEGEGRPATVHVSSTPLDRQEEVLSEAESGKRRWTNEEIREYVEETEELSEVDRDTLLWLLDLAARLSFGGRVTQSKTKHPSFGWRAKLPSENRVRTIWSAWPGYDVVWIYRSGLRAMTSEAEAERLDEAFATLTDERQTVGSEYITIPLAGLAAVRERFEDLCARIVASSERSGR